MKPTYDELVKTIEDQHKAIDWLAASLMVATREQRTHAPFFLSKSPIWDAVVRGNDILIRAKET